MITVTLRRLRLLVRRSFLLATHYSLLRPPSTVFRFDGAIRYVVGRELARASIAPASSRPTRYDSKQKTLVRHHARTCRG